MPSISQEKAICNPSWKKNRVLSKVHVGRVGGIIKLKGKMPLGRLELPFLAPEANALSTELQGLGIKFYHK
jgi:hypothetical protein